MIQWMDDFTSYGTDTAKLLDGSYAERAFVSLVADPDPNAPGENVLVMGANSSSMFRKVLSAPQSTVGVAARYWLTALPSNTTLIPIFFRLSDTSNIAQITVEVNPSGYFEVYRWDSSKTLIGQSSSPVVVTNAWRHVETKVVLHATAGSVEVRVEGTTVVSLTGIQTIPTGTGSASTAQNISFMNFAAGSTTGAPSIYIKDLIVWDGTGTINNSFIGTCQVYKIVPDGDVSLGFSPSSGTTGYNLINENTPDDDAGYVSAATAGLTAEFTLTDLPVNVTAVKGVMVVNRSKKVDGGDGNLKVSLISGASTGDGADRPITTAYTYWHDVFDQDPSGTNWSKTLVNALHLKLNRTV